MKEVYYRLQMSVNLQPSKHAHMGPVRFLSGNWYGFDEGNVSGMRMGTTWANRNDNIPTLNPILKYI